jgi:hypothetical protein
MLLILQTQSRAKATWDTWLYVFGATLALVLVLWLVNKLLKPKQYRGGVGNALMTAEVFFRPSRENILEAKRREDKQQDESGDPPDTSN